MKNLLIQPFTRSTIQRVKEYAFTLAETLIVIGIIGVVAALTLPNLNHATGDKETVTRVKKIYSSLTEAFDRAQAIYGPYDEWYNDIEDDKKMCSERFAKRVTEFMKVSKDCGFNKGCFSTAGYTFVSGELIGDEPFDIDGDEGLYKITTPDGMSISFEVGLGANDNDVHVDVDGPNKGKNAYGRDLFLFSIEKGSNTLYPYLQREIENVHYDDSVITDYLCHRGDLTTYWVIKNDNLDYLKADKYTAKCSNSSIVLNLTTNSSCH